MVSAWPEPPSVIPAEWPVERTAGARTKRNETGVRSIAIERQWPMLSARRWHTIRPEISTDDSILHGLLRSLPHSLHSLHSLHRSKENIPHRSKENIPHRSKENIPHRSKENIPHRSKENHSKHVDRLDDKPGERADGRVVH